MVKLASYFGFASSNSSTREYHPDRAQTRAATCKVASTATGKEGEASSTTTGKLEAAQARAALAGAAQTGSVKSTAAAGAGTAGGEVMGAITRVTSWKIPRALDGPLAKCKGCSSVRNFESGPESTKR